MPSNINKQKIIPIISLFLSRSCCAAAQGLHGEGGHRLLPPDGQCATLGIASLHLTGDAQLWYKQYKANMDLPSPTWCCLTELIIQFGPRLCSDALGELISFKRTSLVGDYNKFTVLLCRVP
jgi:hypothetical protein